MKRKFKVGDKVRVCSLNGEMSIGYGIVKQGMVGEIHYVEPSYYGGKLVYSVVIPELAGQLGSGVERGVQMDAFWCEESMLERIQDETIMIYREGNKVIALDKRTNTKHVAVCSPEDEFDFLTGANLAFNRLYEYECKPKYYNGKVVCIKDFPTLTTKGKIYEFVDGSITFDNGDKSDDRFRVKCFEDINRIYNSKFIEVVE